MKWWTYQRDAHFMQLPRTLWPLFGRRTATTRMLSSVQSTFPGSEHLFETWGSLEQHSHVTWVLTCVHFISVLADPQ